MANATPRDRLPSDTSWCMQQLENSPKLATGGVFHGIKEVHVHATTTNTTLKTPRHSVDLAAIPAVDRKTC